MKMRKAVFILLLSALLVIGMALTGCPSDDSGETVTPGTNKPLELARHPASKSCTLAEWLAATEVYKTLTVVPPASLSNVSYQWYSRVSSTSEGTPISGATRASYMPEISSAGMYYYYVTVTSGATELVSGTANIRITEAAETAPTQFTIGTNRLNYVRGVGGTGSFMFRDGSNADASPDADVRYIDLLMGEIGCNILRIMVQDDYLNYIKNDVQSRNQTVFFHNARDNFFAVIRRVNDYGGYVFANPWTGPGEFKENGQVRGGNIKNTPQNFVGYADWLRGFLKWLNENQAPVFSLGILNEPDNGATAAYEGMGMASGVHRDFFRTVGHFTTQRVTNQSGAGVDSSIYEDDIIPGWGGGSRTHHVLAMTADNMGQPSYYNDIINSNSGTTPANNNFEILGHHMYNSTARVTALAGINATIAWADRPQTNYVGRYEAESLAQSKQMYAPGSSAGNIKREVWQTEHDYNYNGNSTNIPGSNVQRYWNSAFAAMNDVDWCLRVNHESVYDWWFSSSYSGLVTSYQGTPINGNGQTGAAGATAWPAYTYTPRGRAFAHYARYVNETWLLDISRTKGDIEFNRTGTTSATFNAGATDPKISAFEDTDGKFITIVMFTPNASTSTNAGASTSGSIGGGFGAGGLNGINDPTRLSIDVGRIEVVLPQGFTATSASALRSYGWENATGENWDDVPIGTPRYWINEPVFLSADGKSVEVTLPGGNIISIMVKGSWASGSGRHFEPRVRPYTVN
jgi:hypothetical protein